MKNTVKCTNWNEYEGLNGVVMFCEAGAYGKNLTPDEARGFGCTSVKRAECLKAMINSSGFGLLPEIITEASAKETLQKQELVLVVA